MYKNVFLLLTSSILLYLLYISSLYLSVNMYLLLTGWSAYSKLEWRTVPMCWSIRPYVTTHTTRSLQSTRKSSVSVLCLLLHCGSHTSIFSATYTRRCPHHLSICKRKLTWLWSHTTHIAYAVSTCRYTSVRECQVHWRQLYMSRVRMWQGFYNVFKYLKFITMLIVF
jgi:hypothetical protein